MPESENKIMLLRQLLENAQDNLTQVKLMLAEIDPGEFNELKEKAKDLGKIEQSGKDQIVEGIFDGENMVGADGKIYSIPANYVSKSKLVEGDMLKLTIKTDGTFLYKQIGPVERKRQVGILVKDQAAGEYRVSVGRKSYRVITAAITYFKGEPGDEVVLLTVTDGSSKWAAVENIVKKVPLAEKKLLTDGSAAELPAGADTELEDGTKNLLTNSILEDID